MVRGRWVEDPVRGRRGRACGDRESIARRAN